MKPLLYISYDGMLEPLGQSQVLAYLEKLTDTRRIHLLSFEKPEDWQDSAAREALHERIRTAGIIWHPRRYHRRPSAPATAWDISIGIITGLWLILRHRIGIVHARSDVAAAMALTLKRLTGVKFIFDMRGFWADERVDGGLWSRESRLYRITKALERRFLLGADHVVSLTEAAVHEMQRFDYLQGHALPVTVIPTCADLTRFTPPQQHREPPFVLGYVGSVGTWYLFDSVIDSFRLLRERIPDARLLILNRNEHEYIRARLQAGGITSDAVELHAATHAEVPHFMARMHASAFFIKPVFSKQASAPTKLAECLGCGIPCLGNAGVGDMANILESERVGVAVTAFDPDSLRHGLDRLLALCREDGIQARCVAAAHRHFSLQQGVARYRAIHAALDD